MFPALRLDWRPVFLGFPGFRTLRRVWSQKRFSLSHAQDCQVDHWLADFFSFSFPSVVRTAFE